MQVTTPVPTFGQQNVDRFRDSAVAYARSALLRVTTEEDPVRGAVDAGMATEHIAKAYLCSLSPALIADRNADIDTMLHLTGLGHLAKCGAHEVKTIGAHEACLRCARLVPAFTYTLQADQALFVARNGGAHLALTSDEAARESARIMVRLCEPLLAALSVDRSAFWGSMEAVADVLLDETTTQIMEDLEVKIAAARSRFEVRLAGLVLRERDAVIKALTERGYSSSEEEDYECPACSQTGVILCEINDDGDPHFEYEQVAEDDFIYHGGYIDQIAYALQFSCSACGLDLDFDEMTAAEMPTDFERESRSCEPWEFGN